MKIRIGYIIKKYREAHNYDPQESREERSYILRMTNQLRKKISWKNWLMPWEAHGLTW